MRGRQFPPCPRRTPAAGVGAGEGVRVAAAGVTAGVACSDDFAATNHAAGVAAGVESDEQKQMAGFDAAWMAGLAAMVGQAAYLAVGEARSVASQKAATAGG